MELLSDVGTEGTSLNGRAVGLVHAISLLMVYINSILIKLLKQGTVYVYFWTKNRFF